jgi:hypothetical protein
MERGSALWSLGVLALLLIAAFIAGHPPIQWRWKLLALALPPAVAWAFYAYYLNTMSALCREDDECSMRALGPFALAVATSVVCIICALLARKRPDRVDALASGGSSGTASTSSRRWLLRSGRRPKRKRSTLKGSTAINTHTPQEKIAVSRPKESVSCLIGSGSETLSARPSFDGSSESCSMRLRCSRRRFGLSSTGRATSADRPRRSGRDGAG